MRAMISFGAAIALALTLAPARARAEVEPAHFHHVHLNVTDPEATLRFYQRIFGAIQVNFRGGPPALFTERSFFLLNKVDSPPPSARKSGIWHIGWGGVDVPNEYKWFKSQGVKMHTDIYQLGRGWVTYWLGPDEEMIEVNTMGHHRYAHVHMIAADVNATAKWYGDNLGLNVRRNAENNPKPTVGWTEFHKTSRAWSNGFRCDNVSIAVYNQPNYEPKPPWWHEDLVTEFEPTRGRVIDHLGFSYRDIEPIFDRMKAAGVEIVEPIAERTEFKMKSFFVLAPDGVLIEIVEAKPIPEGVWD